MKTGESVTVTIGKQSAAPLAKQFNIITLRTGNGRKGKIYNMVMDDAFLKEGSVTISMRRLNVVSWWPGREIQLWAIRKAFKEK